MRAPIAFAFVAFMTKHPLGIRRNEYGDAVRNRRPICALAKTADQIRPNRNALWKRVNPKRCCGNGPRMLPAQLKCSSPVCACPTIMVIVPPQWAIS